MNPKLKVILKIISNVLAVIVVVFVFLLYGLQFFGLKPYSVLSGSMQSVYPTGSLIYVKEVDTDTLKVNDVITFYLSSNIVGTHRIVDIIPVENNPDKVQYQTKGDENKSVDENLVAPENIIGTPVFCIPYLGFLGTYVSSPPGRYVAITAVIAIIIIEIMISIVLDDKDKKKTQPEQN